MVSLVLLFLSALIVFGADAEARSLEEELSIRTERERLEIYVYQITLLCDSQIEEIAAAIPTERVEALRRDHYVWKLDRGIYCSEAGRHSSPPRWGRSTRRAPGTTSTSRLVVASG